MYEKNKSENSGVYCLTCGEYNGQMGRRINTLFQYNEIFEVILDNDRYLTSLPTQPPYLANEKHHSRQQGLSVHISRTSHTVNVVQNIIVPLGQLPTITVQSLKDGKYEQVLISP